MSSDDLEAIVNTAESARLKLFKNIEVGSAEFHKLISAVSITLKKNQISSCLICNIGFLFYV